MSERDRSRENDDDVQQGDTERKHGEFILAAMDDARERRESGQDPLLEALSRAHQAKASEAEANNE
jgi:hypothetical protein